MAMTLRHASKRNPTFNAELMLADTLYMTAQSEGFGKQYPCRRVGINYAKKEVLVEAWYPTLQIWSKVAVPFNYQVRNLKETETMKLRASVAAKGTPVKTDKEYFRKTVGATTGKGVADTWGIAFQKHGKAENPVAAIVAFMKAEYPKRTTNWGKWVNGMRQRYNRGKLGVPEPTVKLNVLVDEVKPKKK